jgi:glutamate formiminotransferase
MAFDTVDLNRHVGSFPRIGALDSCRLMPLAPTPEDRRLLRLSALRFARWLATRHHVPVVLDERLQSSGKDHYVESLRAKGFGMLLHTRIGADVGPDTAHPRLGVVVLAESEFLLTAWVLLADDQLHLATQLADQAHHLRAEGDERFLGVACGAYPLASQGLSLLEMQWAMPEVTGCDPALEWAIARANEADVVVPAVRLVGAIRESDIPRCARLPLEPRQVIAGA